MPRNNHDSIHIWLCIVFVYCVFLVISSSSPAVTLTNGDEPHYLVMTQSILVDGDIDVTNQYADRQYEPWYDLDLKPHMFRLAGGAFSFHQELLPLLVLPGFTIAGYFGAAVTMILIIAVACANLYAILRRHVSYRAAWWTLAAVSLSLPVVVLGRMIFPEVIACAVVMVTLNAFDYYQGKPWPLRTLIGILLLLSLLPFFHFKFGIISATLYIILFWQLFRKKEFHGGVRIAMILIPIIAGICFLLSFQWVYGTSFSEYVFVRVVKRKFIAFTYLHGILRSWLDQRTGILLYAPVYICSIIGAVSMAGMRKHAVLFWNMLAIVLAYGIPMTVFFVGTGGYAPPSRFLAPMLFVIAVWMAYGIDALFAVRMRWLWYALAIYSITFGLLSVVHPPFAFPTAAVATALNDLHRYYGIDIAWLFPNLYALHTPVETMKALLWAGAIGMLCAIPLMRMARLRHAKGSVQRESQTT